MARDGPRFRKNSPAAGRSTLNYVVCIIALNEICVSAALGTSWSPCLVLLLCPFPCPRPLIKLSSPYYISRRVLVTRYAQLNHAAAMKSCRIEKAATINYGISWRKLRIQRFFERGPGKMSTHARGPLMYTTNTREYLKEETKFVEIAKGGLGGSDLWSRVVVAHGRQNK